MLTLNQIISQITDLANAHYQIAEVGTGTIAELQSKPDRDYPLLWLSNEGGSLDQNYKIDNIRLTMFGRVIAGEEGQDDDASELEVLSDMQLILLDFLNYFHQNHSQDYVTDKAAQLEHFTERTNDRTAGYSCVLELKQFYDWNKCQIPQSGASIPPTIDGLTLYDFCDQSVLDRLTPTQTACLEAEFAQCDPVTVQVNSVTVATPASGDTYNLNVQDSAGASVGTSANPSVVSDSTININGVDEDVTKAESIFNMFVKLDGVQSGTYDVPTKTVNVTSPPCADANYTNSDGSYSGTVASGGTLNIPNITVTDSDGSTSSVPSVQDVVCTPANYGTLIASVLQREFEQNVMMAFSLVYVKDNYSGAVINVRRSGDNAAADFTPTEITDGTLTAWVVAGGGTQFGYVTKFYDQSGNGFALFNTNSAYQWSIVESGVLVVDSQGNPTTKATSTQGWIIGSSVLSLKQIDFFTTSACSWAALKVDASVGNAWFHSVGGSPSYARVGTGTFLNSQDAGSPITKVNNTVLADQNRDTLKTAMSGNEVIINTIDIDFTASGTWSSNTQVKIGLSYPIGSTFSEFVLTSTDNSANQDYIFANRNAYYNYY